jgi:hypothetical protein
LELSPAGFQPFTDSISSIHTLPGYTLGSGAGETRTGQGGKKMNAHTALKGACLTLCLIGLMTLPVMAANGGAGQNAKASVDPDLISDLWNSHEHYRLAHFDLNVQHANDVIGILENYSIDGTPLEETLATISAKRPELQAALGNRDRQALKNVNNELKGLWREFVKETRDAIRDHYGNGADAAALLNTGVMGTISG